MRLSPRRFALAAPMAALASLLFLAGSPAHAQVPRPFRIIGAGVGPEGLPLPGEAPRPHWAIGEATQLGSYYGEGTVATDSAAFDPATGHIKGTFGSGSPFTFFGGHGDRLVCQYGRTAYGASQPGTVDLTILGSTPDGQPIVQALWIAEFVPQPDLCTGKFAGVTGNWIMVAHSAPFVLGSDDPAFYWWQGEGTLIYPSE
jgi:hypothetical protein